MPQPIHFLIADDHPIFRKGLKDILTDAFKTIKIIECDNGVEALELIKKTEPAIAILDVNMPKKNGLEVLHNLFKERITGTRVIILTMYKEKELIKKAVHYGAFGYMLKDSAARELVECINMVNSGEKFISSELSSFHKEIAKEDNTEREFIDLLQSLSQAEIKVLKLVSQHKSTKEIASLLFLSEKTIENYRSHICQKLLLPPRNNSLLLWINEHKDLIYSINEF